MADAMALAVDMAGDTGTRIGARLGMLRYRADAGTLLSFVRLLAEAPTKKARGAVMALSPFMSEAEARGRYAFRGSSEERREASRNMSPIFGGLV